MNPIKSYFVENQNGMVVNKKIRLLSRQNRAIRKRTSGKRVGKSRPEKANNQLNRRVK